MTNKHTDEMRVNLFDAWIETDEAQSILCSFDELEIAGAAWDASKKAATASAEAKYLPVIEEASALLAAFDYKAAHGDNDTYRAMKKGRWDKLRKALAIAAPLLKGE